MCGQLWRLNDCLQEEELPSPVLHYTLEASIGSEVRVTSVMRKGIELLTVQTYSLQEQGDERVLVVAKGGLTSIESLTVLSVRMTTSGARPGNAQS